MQASLQQFARAFANHVKNRARSQAAKPEARAKARAACKMQAEPADVFTKQFLAPFCGLLTAVDGLACDSYHVGVEGGCSTVASEQEYLASLKSGSRTVVAMPFSVAVHVFGVMEPSALWGKVVAASQTQMQALADSKKMFTISEEAQLVQATISSHILTAQAAAVQAAQSLVSRIFECCVFSVIPSSCW